MPVRLRALLLPALVAAVALVAAGCSVSIGDKTIDAGSVEDQISQNLESQGEEIDAVECPGDQKAEAGHHLRVRRHLRRRHHPHGADRARGRRGHVQLHDPARRGRPRAPTRAGVPARPRTAQGDTTRAPPRRGRGHRRVAPGALPLTGEARRADTEPVTDRPAASYAVPVLALVACGIVLTAVLALFVSRADDPSPAAAHRRADERATATRPPGRATARRRRR